MPVEVKTRQVAASSIALAIMQPYLFPYVGYFQLLAAADKFVAYDDVAFIKGGWINRNRWLVSNAPAYFTIPVQDVSSYRSIRETTIASGNWQKKALLTFRQSYARAPLFDEAYFLLSQIMESDEPHIAELAVASIKLVANYLGIATSLVESSAGYGNSYLASRDRNVRLAVIDFDSGAIIGCAYLTDIHRINRAAELGLMIGEKSYWSRGIGTQACLMLLRHAFDDLNLHRIYLSVLAENERAIRLYRKIGFREEGRHREAVFKQDAYRDLLSMAILAREYRELANSKNLAPSTPPEAA